MALSPTESSKQHPLLSFFETAADIMLLTDREGVIRRGNIAFQTFLGTERTAAIQGNSIAQLFQYPVFQQSQIATYLSEVAMHRQLIYTTWQKAIFPLDAVSLSVSLLPDSVEQHYLVVVRPLIVEEQILNKTNLFPIVRKTSTEEQTSLNDIITHSEEIDLLKLQTLLRNRKEFSRVKSKFISIASHEFRTPLSTILASADLIGRYARQMHETRFDHHIQRIKSSVRNLTKLLENFLSLDKLETGDETYELQLVHLPELLQKIIAETRPTLRPEQQIQLSVNLEETELQLDPRIFQIILFSLLNNAAKYSSESSIIQLNVVKSSGYLKLIVADNGIGVPESDRPHIFTRFYRGQNTVNTSGAGLGLNIVQEYLQLLKGRIEFSSQVNQGSTFRVWIPLK